jgi:cytochrome d ubiquinol oxidase subunit I
MLKLVARGPRSHGADHPDDHDPLQKQRAARPLSAAPDDIDPAIDTGRGA